MLKSTLQSRSLDAPSDDDVSEFLQLLVHAVMAFGVLLYAKLGDVFSGDEPIDVTEDLSILVFHVLAHLVHVFVEELQDEERHLVLSRTVDGFEELAPDVQELEVEEKVVGGTQVAHEGGHVDFVHIKLRDRGPLFHDIGHS